MKILIIGRGGREHAIAWKVAQSPLVEKVFVAPGNAGIAQRHVCVPIEETDTESLIKFAQKEKISLTIVGPEAALVNGVVDAFQAIGLPIFGPTQKATQIESSKSYAKELMKKYRIPTSDFELFADYDSAKQYILQKGVPIVIKYNGLAAGKGVVIPRTIEEANDALNEMLLEQKYGKGEVVIEDFLTGPEFSLMTLVNGEEVVALPIAQDHKRAYDGDQGPNTGGMGAYSPVPVIPQAVIDEAMETIMKPTARALVKEGVPFCGVLYGGLMLTPEGPKVIEFNARFGDPETEVVLPKISSDLVQHILDLLAHKPTEIICHSDIFLGVVLASKGYPGKFEKGVAIKGLAEVKNIVFHCGTAFKENQWVNTGGRVLFVVGRGKNAQEAQQDAYRGVEQIKSNNLFYRKDIGYQLF